MTPPTAGLAADYEAGFGDDYQRKLAIVSRRGTLDVTAAEKIRHYTEVQQRIESTLADERNPITVMATIASILKESFAHFYWVGFLFTEEQELVLGPFQGPPACLRLPLNSPGVCGTCYRTAETIVVPDVAGFDGRIGCDIVSKAEIAVPIFFENRVAAILDIDSTELRGVDEVDKVALEQVSRFVSSRLEPTNWPKRVS